MRNHNCLVRPEAACAEDLSLAIYEKSKKLNLRPEQYEQIFQAYEKHIIGEADFKDPKKKGDFQSFYDEIKGICKLKEKEISFLASGEWDRYSTAFVFACELLEKGMPEKAKIICDKEYLLNEASLKKFYQGINKLMKGIKENIKNSAS